MSGEVLRQAATLMRERVEAATPGPWVTRDGNVEHYFPEIGEYGVIANPPAPDAEHIASWHPAVAGEVARLLTALAEELERGDYTVESDVLPTWLHCHIESVAHAYLRGQ